jgi:hypothetical protein
MTSIELMGGVYVVDSNPREFKNAVNKLSKYSQKLTGRKYQFIDAENVTIPLSKIQLNHNGITMDVIIALMPGKTIPDVLFSIIMCKLPKENLVAFFRQLLMWNNLDTDVTHFAINDKLGFVYLISKRPVEDFDYSEFKYVVETMVTSIRNYTFMMTKQFGIIP